MATKTYVTDKDGAVADASTITMPSDRHFRNAWVVSGTVISEDMAAARIIFRGIFYGEFGRKYCMYFSTQYVKTSSGKLFQW